MMTFAELLAACRKAAARITPEERAAIVEAFCPPPAKPAQEDVRVMWCQPKPVPWPDATLCPHDRPRSGPYRCDRCRGIAP